MISTIAMVELGDCDLTVRARAIDALIARASAERQGLCTDMCLNADGSLTMRVTKPVVQATQLEAAP